jgi:hypothetical protein
LTRKFRPGYRSPEGSPLKVPGGAGLVLLLVLVVVSLVVSDVPCNLPLQCLRPAVPDVARTGMRAPQAFKTVRGIAEHILRLDLRGPSAFIILPSTGTLATDLT